MILPDGTLSAAFKVTESTVILTTFRFRPVANALPAFLFILWCDTHSRLASDFQRIETAYAVRIVSSGNCGSRNVIACDPLGARNVAAVNKVADVWFSCPLLGKRRVQMRIGKRFPRARESGRRQRHPWEYRRPVILKGRQWCPSNYSATTPPAGREPRRIFILANNNAAGML